MPILVKTKPKFSQHSAKLKLAWQNPKINAQKCRRAHPACRAKAGGNLSDLSGPDPGDPDLPSRQLRPQILFRVHLAVVPELGERVSPVQKSHFDHCVQGGGWLGPRAQSRGKEPKWQKYLVFAVSPRGRPSGH